MSEFKSTIKALVAHTVATDNANDNRNAAIKKADNEALKKALPAALFALRADGFTKKGDFTKGERTEGSKVQRARATLIDGFIEAKGDKAESSAIKWWNRLRLLASRAAFSKVETAEAFWTKLEGLEIDSMRQLDLYLSPPDMLKRANDQAKALLKTIENLSGAKSDKFLSGADAVTLLHALNGTTEQADEALNMLLG